MGGDDRELILRRVRGALGQSSNRTAYPEYDDRLSVPREPRLDSDPWGAFRARFKAVNGMPFERTEELSDYLALAKFTVGYCDPKLKEILASALGPGIRLETEFDRGRLDEYQFGITRAQGAIAESGSLILTDRGTSDRLGALAPWAHVACIRRGEIFRDMPAAIAAMGDDPNIIWVTGPSKTADVEGILIEGVHGPGVQICLLLPEQVMD